MDTAVLQKVLEIIESSPHSSAALGLYALVSTLKMENSGYRYTLRKLRELDPGHRRLAYELMDFMAQGGNQGPGWNSAVQAMDEAIRGRQEC